MSDFPDLHDPNVAVATGPPSAGTDRAIALASAVYVLLKAARRNEPGAHDEALARLAEARMYLDALEELIIPMIGGPS